MLRRLYIVLPFVCTLIACQPVRNAQQTVAMADSLRVNEGVTCDDSLAISGIAFGKGEMATFIQNGNAVDVCYSIEQNTYNGVTSLQMKVEDIIPATN